MQKKTHHIKKLSTGEREALRSFLTAAVSVSNSIIDERHIKENPNLYKFGLKDLHRAIAALKKLIKQDLS